MKNKKGFSVLSRIFSLKRWAASFTALAIVLSIISNSSPHLLTQMFIPQAKAFSVSVFQSGSCNPGGTEATVNIFLQTDPGHSLDGVLSISNATFQSNTAGGVIGGGGSTLTFTGPGEVGHTFSGTATVSTTPDVGFSITGPINQRQSPFVQTQNVSENGICATNQRPAGGALTPATGNYSESGDVIVPVSVTVDDPDGDNVSIDVNEAETTTSTGAGVPGFFGISDSGPFSDPHTFNFSARIPAGQSSGTFTLKFTPSDATGDGPEETKTFTIVNEEPNIAAPSFSNAHTHGLVAVTVNITDPTTGGSISSATATGTGVSGSSFVDPTLSFNYNPLVGGFNLNDNVTISAFDNASGNTNETVSINIIDNIPTTMIVVDQYNGNNGLVDFDKISQSDVENTGTVCTNITVTNNDADVLDQGAASTSVTTETGVSVTGAAATSVPFDGTATAGQICIDSALFTAFGGVALFEWTPGGAGHPTVSEEVQHGENSGSDRKRRGNAPIIKKLGENTAAQSGTDADDSTTLGGGEEDIEEIIAIADRYTQLDIESPFGHLIDDSTFTDVLVSGDIDEELVATSDSGDRGAGGLEDEQEIDHSSDGDSSNQFSFQNTGYISSGTVVFDGIDNNRNPLLATDYFVRDASSGIEFGNTAIHESGFNSGVFQSDFMIPSTSAFGQELGTSSLSSTGFSLTESGPTDGLFTGDFQVPSEFRSRADDKRQLDLSTIPQLRETYPGSGVFTQNDGVFGEVPTAFLHGSADLSQAGDRQEDVFQVSSLQTGESNNGGVIGRLGSNLVIEVVVEPEINYEDVDEELIASNDSKDKGAGGLEDEPDLEVSTDLFANSGSIQNLPVLVDIYDPALQPQTTLFDEFYQNSGREIDPTYLERTTVFDEFDQTPVVETSPNVEFFATEEELQTIFENLNVIVDEVLLGDEEIRVIPPTGITIIPTQNEGASFTIPGTYTGYQPGDSVDVTEDRGGLTITAFPLKTTLKDQLTLGRTDGQNRTGFAKPERIGTIQVDVSVSTSNFYSRAHTVDVITPTISRAGAFSSNIVIQNKDTVGLNSVDVNYSFLSEEDKQIDFLFTDGFAEGQLDRWRRIDFE